MKKLLLALGLLLLSSPAFAGSGTLAVTPGSGATIATTTDGSANNLPHDVICDQSAGANCAGVDASHNLGVVLETGGTITLVPATTGGNSMYTGALTNTAVAVDASAGQVYGYYFYNSNSSVCYIQFYNTAQGSVSVGTTTPVLSLGIPATGGANVAFPNGLAFGTAITIAATTTRANGSACSNSIDANVIYK